MDEITILQEIHEHIDTVISRDSSLGVYLWNALVKLHPADIARFLTDIEEENFKVLFLQFPKELQLEVLMNYQGQVKLRPLDAMDEQGKADALNRLPADELTDLF